MRKELPEYCAEYAKIIAQAMQGGDHGTCRMVFSGPGAGVITAAIILAEAAVLHEGLWRSSPVLRPEARGGATRSD